MDKKYIYAITTKFLNKLKEEYSTLNFCYYLDKHTDDLIKTLHVKFKLDYIIQHREEIQLAIEKFFAPLYNVKVSFVKDKKFKIITKVLHEDSHFDDNLIAKLIPNIIPFRKELVEQLRAHIGIKIKDEVREALLALIDENSNEQKEALKLALKEALDLDKRDFITFLHDAIVIKQFKLNGYERRASTLPIEELEKLKIEFCPNEESKIKLLIKSIKSALDGELNLSHIDNLFFIHHYKEIIQKSIKEVLKEEAKDKEIDSDVIEPFSEYIVNENSAFFLEKIAKRLLRLVMNRDENATQFLKYYNGDIDIDKNGRYKKPEIIDENHRKWNPAIIVTVAIQYSNDLHTLEKLDLHIKELENKLKDGENETDKYSIVLKHTEDKLKDIPREIRYIDMDINEFTSKLNELKTIYRVSEDKEEIQNKIDELSIKIKNLNKQKDEFLNEEREFESKLDLVKSKISTIKTMEANISRNLAETFKRKEILLKSQKQTKDKFDKLTKLLAKVLVKNRVKIN